MVNILGNFKLLESWKVITVSFSFARTLSELAKMATNRFTGVEDRFGGIIVDSTSESVTDPNEFNLRLAESLQFWITSAKRGIWFKVHLNNSNWIPVLSKNEFTFHHAQKEYVMMVRWLPEGEACAIPCYPHNYVGVGAFVVNDNEEVLVVKERYYIDQPFWKLPGGYVESESFIPRWIKMFIFSLFWNDVGEDLGSAAEREVLEETGIKAKFVSLMAFRHVHKVQFQCSDLYFVCQLTPHSDEISKCERELLDCKWMPIQEYSSDPVGSKINQYIAKCYFENKSKDVSLTPSTIKFKGRSHCVYSIIDVNSTQEIQEDSKKS